MQRISGLVLSEHVVADISNRLRAKLHSFLCDGLELVVPSPVHVEIILHDRIENTKSVKKKDRRHLKAAVQTS